MGCVEVVCKEEPEGGGGGGELCSTPVDIPNPPKAGAGALVLAGCMPDIPLIGSDPDPPTPIPDICAGINDKGVGIIVVVISDGGR